MPTPCRLLSFGTVEACKRRDDENKNVEFHSTAKLIDAESVSISYVQDVRFIA